jgi:hypothetical protein
MSFMVALAFPRDSMIFSFSPLSMSGISLTLASHGYIIRFQKTVLEKIDPMSIDSENFLYYPHFTFVTKKMSENNSFSMRIKNLMVYVSCLTLFKGFITIFPSDTNSLLYLQSLLHCSLRLRFLFPRRIQT